MAPINPHTKNQILAHLAEADRVMRGLEHSETSMELRDEVVWLWNEVRDRL